MPTDSAQETPMEKWLSLLIDQTKFGNVRWHRLEDHWSFTAFLPSGSVTLTAVDDDATFPLVLATADSEGNDDARWLVMHPDTRQREMTERTAALVGQLWELVKTSQGGNTIMNMIRDLEQLPPF